jgi:DNA-binding SARP family transcriptional activator
MNDLVFGILGPLRVWDGSRTVFARGTKRDVILGTLLLAANRVVSVDELVETVWPTPPRSAVANVHTYVSGLRASLPPAGSSARLERTARGYLLRAEPDELDATLFERLLGDVAGAEPAAGATAGAEPAAGATAGAELAGGALAAIGRALELWRGQPLSGLPAAPAWQARLDQLAELRRMARERRVRLWVEDAQYEPAIVELRALIAEDQFGEELWRQLMVALRAAGRAAEALRAYQQVRGLLVGELGIEPGTSLREAHAAVLRGDDASSFRTMWQLPPDLPDFTGRGVEVRALVDRLAASGLAACPSVAVVVGPPGVGKTALAVHAAHLLRTQFPDGQLFLGLGATGEPGEALAELLRTLGVWGPGLPASVAGRAALYRSLLRGRRVIVVLDDVTGSAQVSALLPPDGGSALLVTSRRHLAELPGGHELDLDVLTTADARDLLRAIVGPRRADAEPAAVDSIVAACGRLPLAIRIAGARLAGRRPWALWLLAERLQDRMSRLDELSAGDLDVRSSIERSIRSLPPVALDALHGLALLGAVDSGGMVDSPAWTVDRLLDRVDNADQPLAAQRALDALVETSLVREVGPDPTGQPRYRLHGLVGCYALESAWTAPPGPRRGAIARALSGWLGLAERAASRLPVCVFRAGAGSAPRWAPDPALAARVAAHPLAWFEAERAALVNAVELASDAGLDELAWELATALVPYLDHGGYLDDWQRTHEAALSAVRAAGNVRGEAALLRGLGQVDLYRDVFDRAYESIDRSRRLCGQIGDVRGEAVGIAGIGTIERVVGDSGRALEHYRRALPMFVATGDRHAEAQTRNAIGTVYRASGALDEAATWLNQALHVAAAVRDRHRVACVLTQIGELQLADGSADRALRTLQQAVALFGKVNDPRCRAQASQPLARALAAAV